MFLIIMDVELKWLRENPQINKKNTNNILLYK